MLNLIIGNKAYSPGRSRLAAVKHRIPFERSPYDVHANGTNDGRLRVRAIGAGPILWDDRRLSGTAAIIECLRQDRQGFTGPATITALAGPIDGRGNAFQHQICRADFDERPHASPGELSEPVRQEILLISNYGTVRVPQAAGAYLFAISARSHHFAPC